MGLQFNVSLTDEELETFITLYNKHARTPVTTDSVFQNQESITHAIEDEMVGLWLDKIQSNIKHVYRDYAPAFLDVD